MCINVYGGVMYVWGNIGPYIVSHYREIGDESANHKTAIIVLPISLAVMALTNPLGVWLLKKLNPKVVLLIGTLIMIITLFLAKVTTSWWLFVLFYGGLLPISSGLMYTVPIVLGWEWFPNHKGLICGLNIGSNAFGSFS